MGQADLPVAPALNNQWLVTLTDIQPANDYDDGQPV